MSSYLDKAGLTTLWSKIKSLFATKSELSNGLNTKANTSHTHSYTDLSNKPTIPVIDSALSATSTNGLQNKVIKSALDGKANSSHTHTKSQITDFPALATVATSGSYNDLSNKPTIPTVNNATLTIQKNGKSAGTFTANASANKTINITVPTKVSDLDNDSGFLTEHQDISGLETKANAITGLSVNGKVITYTKGDGSTGTITTQDTNTDTKVTNTLGNTTKAYITGTTSAKTNTGTQIFDSGVYLTTTAGQLHADIDFPITEAQVNEILGIS